MKKIYHLQTCSTCAAINNDLGLKDSQSDGKKFTFQNIKEEKITADQLEGMKKLAGSYEALFSRRAIKYKEMNLKEKVLTEKDYQQLILDEYTFLKRPVIIINDQIFIGSEKKTIETLRGLLSIKK